MVPAPRRQFFEGDCRKTVIFDEIRQMYAHSCYIFAEFVAHGTYRQ